MNPSKARIQLDSIIIFSVALIARVLFDLYLQHTYGFYHYPNTDDVGYYLGWAQEISRHSWLGNETFMGLPLYPYFLAVLDTLLGGHLPSMRLAHMMLGSLNCILIYRIGLKIFSRRVALIAGLLTALTFTCVYYDRLLMPPTLLVFLGSLMILALLSMEKEGTPCRWFLLGILFGLGTLGDGKFLFFLLFLIGWIVIADRRRVLTTLRACIIPLCLGAALVIFLTGARNRLVGGEWIWISGQSGLNLFYGNNPQAKGYYENPREFRPNHTGQDIDLVLTAEQLSGEDLTPSEASAFYRRLALRFVTQQPGAWLQLIGKKIYLFLSESEYTFDMDLIFLRELRTAVDLNAFGLIAPLAVLGMWIGRRNGGSPYLYMIIAAQCLFVLVFYLLNRYRASIVPFLIIFESAALIWLVETYFQKKYARLLLTVLTIAAYMLVFQPRLIDAATRAFLYYSKAGFVFEQEQQLELAKESYQKALAIQPDDTTSLFNLGNIHFGQGNLAGAMDAYRSVIHLNPIHLDAYFNLGVALEEIGRTAEAQDLYRTVLNMTPESIDARYRLGRLLIEQGRCDEADKEMEHITRLNPAYTPEVRMLLSTCTN